MQINITSRRHQLSEHLKDYVNEKVGKLEKYVHGTAEAHVVLERTDLNQIVEINFHGLNKTMHAREEDENVRACIDKAVDKIEAQVKKQKEKLVEKR